MLAHARDMRALVSTAHLRVFIAHSLAAHTQGGCALVDGVALASTSGSHDVALENGVAAVLTFSQVRAVDSKLVPLAVALLYMLTPKICIPPPLGQALKRWWPVHSSTVAAVSRTATQASTTRTLTAAGVMR